MSENEQNEGTGALDLSGLGSFDFTPAWAKGKSDDMSRYARFEQRDDDGERRGRDSRGGERRGGFGGRPSFGGPRRDERGQRPFGDRPARPAFGDRPREGGDRPRRDDRGGRQFGDRAPRREFVRALDAEVRVLPNQKTLGEIARKIQSEHKAYSLRQLSNFFLDNPKALVLRVTPRDAAAPAFHTCKACGFVARDAEELSAHLVAAHLTDYFTPEEIDCEPPKGNFSCVAKCGLSGELLGPPNLHGYDARVKEMIRTRYPSMDEQAYRSRIEIVHDKDVVEQWRASAVKKTVFHRKGTEEILEREAAEGEFRRTIAPAMTAESKSVDVPGDVALASKDLPFLFACRDAIRREQNARRPDFRAAGAPPPPPPLISALRGAFHSRKLAFFRANDPRGPEFVSVAAPVAFDAEHAIPELGEIAKYFAERGCVPWAQAVAEISAGDAEKAKTVQTHLHWFAEKGHLVLFSDGLISAAAKNPLHRPPRKPQPAKPAEANTEETPAAEAAPTETPAAEATEEKPAEAVPAEVPVAEVAPAAEVKVEETLVAEAAPTEATPAEAAPTEAAPAEANA